MNRNNPFADWSDDALGGEVDRTQYFPPPQQPPSPSPPQQPPPLPSAPPATLKGLASRDPFEQTQLLDQPLQPHELTPDVYRGLAPADEVVHHRPDNPIVGAALPLLNLMVALKNTAFHQNQGELRREAIKAVKGFELEARRRGVEDRNLYYARYALCTALDDIVHHTPWGSVGEWRQESLLATFYNEAEGGEKFFYLLKELLQDPSTHRDLLELLYLCITLGFQGRYRVLGGEGRAQLDAIRLRVYQAIQRASEADLKALSPHGKSHFQPAPQRSIPIPLWSVAALVGALVTTLYVGLAFSLNRHSDPPATALAALRVAPLTPVAAPTAEPSIAQALPLDCSQTPRPLGCPPVAAAPVSPPPPALPQPPPPPAPKAQLATLLRADIDQGRLQLGGEERTPVITLVGESFASGKAEVSQGYLPTLQRLAQALQRFPGQIYVTGHTDNIPIRTVRFPSNFHLSTARAKAVATILLQNGVPRERFRVEGKAAAEPVAPNDTPANRARNRRVEITLYAPNPNYGAGS